MLELGQFLDNLRDHKEPEQHVERVETMTQLFDNLVDFLRDETSFPNNKINQLATLMWRLIGNEHITVALDPTGYMPSVSFAVLAEGYERIPILFLPQNFISQTARAPEVQVGVFAYMASQCRDYFVNKIMGDNTQEVNKRAQAYEAEALLTLSELALEEDIKLELIDFQYQILEAFPNGLADLNEELRYNTPSYESVVSLIQNYRMN